MRGVISDLNSSRKDVRVGDCVTVGSWVSEFETVFLLEVAWEYDGLSLLLSWFDTAWCGGSLEELNVEKKFGFWFWSQEVVLPIKKNVLIETWNIIHQLFKLAFSVQYLILRYSVH